MSKLLAILIGSAITYSVWFVRRRGARTRLRELDEGKRCVSCHGTQLAVTEDVAACLQCGHRASLAALRRAALTDADIAKATRPNDPSF